MAAVLRTTNKSPKSNKKTKLITSMLPTHLAASLAPVATLPGYVIIIKCQLQCYFGSQTSPVTPVFVSKQRPCLCPEMYIGVRGF